MDPEGNKHESFESLCKYGVDIISSLAQTSPENFFEYVVDVTQHLFEYKWGEDEGKKTSAPLVVMENINAGEKGWIKNIIEDDYAAVNESYKIVENGKSISIWETIDQFKKLENLSENYTIYDLELETEKSENKDEWGKISYDGKWLMKSEWEGKFAEFKRKELTHLQSLVILRGNFQSGEENDSSEGNNKLQKENVLIAICSPMKKETIEEFAKDYSEHFLGAISQKLPCIKISRIKEDIAKIEDEYGFSGFDASAIQFPFLSKALNKLTSKLDPLIKLYLKEHRKKFIALFLFSLPIKEEEEQFFRYIFSEYQDSIISENKADIKAAILKELEAYKEQWKEGSEEKREEFYRAINDFIEDEGIYNILLKRPWGGKDTFIGYCGLSGGQVSLYVPNWKKSIYNIDVPSLVEFKTKGKEKDSVFRYTQLMIEKELLGASGLVDVPIRVGKRMVGAVQIANNADIKIRDRLKILNVIWHSMDEIKGFLVADVEHIKLSKKIAEKRLLEGMSVFAHLTAHSSTKLFTTPIKNSTDTIEQNIKKLSSKLEKNRNEFEEELEKINSITKREIPIIKRTTRLWENYLTVIDRYGKIEEERMELNPRIIDWTKMKNELEFYGEALFYSHSNDLFDDKSYEEIKDLIEKNDVVFHKKSERAFFNLNIFYDEDLRNKFFAHQDILEMHLINFLENAIEAANLTEAAQCYMNMGIIRKKYMKNIDFKLKNNREELYIILEISNNCGITEADKAELDELRNTIGDFQDNDFTDAKSTILDHGEEGGLRNRMIKREFTSKSGGGSGWGMILAADYLHRLQVYRQVDNKKILVRRGKLIIDFKDRNKRDRGESEGEERDVTFEMYFPFPEKDEWIEFM